MRIFAASMCALLVGAGCASVIGLDFDTYREGVSGDAASGPQCVPNSTLRCLCELSEGTQTCSESGRLSPCVCGDGGEEAGRVQCGNGRLEMGEACDDGNPVSGDGCGNLCVPDGRPAIVEGCPGQPVVVWPGIGVRIDLGTFVRGAAPDGGTCGFLPQADRVYSIVAAKAGQLEIVVTTNAPLSFSVRSVCSSPASPLSCDAVPAGTPVSRKLNVELGKTYFLVLEPRQVSATAIYSIELKGL